MEVEQVAAREGVDAARLRDDFAAGAVAIIKNSLRNIQPVGVGKGLKTKINANIGWSPDRLDSEIELKKLSVAIEFGADTVMDLSIGGDPVGMLKLVLERSSVPVGTVPLYQAAAKMRTKSKSVLDMTIDDFLSVIEAQARAGVDFMTIHAGVTRGAMESLKSQPRLTGITSRGGSIIAEWMTHNGRENPLYERYSDVLDIMAEFNVVISLGDGLRPGSLHDAQDRGQLHEMIVLGELARRAREKGVQAIIEGPGHMQLDRIADNMRLEKTLCDGAPYYVLGPLVTDIAPGYDHITAAIGGAVAAASGADFLCYVTPAEHLRLPTPDDVREGVVASRIAAHAADVVKMGSYARASDDAMSSARRERSWNDMFKHAIDPQRARSMRGELPSAEEDQCSMCGEYCAMKRTY